MWMLDLLRKRPTVKPRRDQELVTLEKDLLRCKADAAALEGAFGLLGSRSDFEADQKRAKLRPKILAAREEIASYEVVVAAMREKLALINELAPLSSEKRPALIARVEAIKASLVVPDRSTMLNVWMDGREVEHLRRVLHEATADPEFAKPYDPLDDIKFFWHQQQVERQRVFTHYLSVPHRPVPPTPTWASKAQRVIELHEAVKGVAV
jgi:hypothetical protein